MPSKPKLKDMWPGEKRVASFDFSEQPEAEGAGGFENPIVTVEPPSGLSLGTPQVTDDVTDLVRVEAEAVDPGIYRLKATVDSHLGATLIMYGRIRILDPDAVIPVQ